MLTASETFHQQTAAVKADVPRNATERAPDHLGFVDALRGLAALYVALFHLALVPHPNLQLARWMKPFLLSGGSGVTLFFVVSAFTLSLSLRARKDERYPTLRFYLRRVFRIVPLFYVWFLLSLARDRFLFGQMHWPKELLLNLTFGFTFVPGLNAGIVWASWTLGVEMTFYLLFPLIFWLINCWWKALAFFLISLMTSFGYHTLIAHSSLHGDMSQQFYTLSLWRNLPAFALGIFAFFVYERWVQDKGRPRSWAIALVSAAGCSMALSILLRRHLVHDTLALDSITYCCLLLGLAVSPLKLFVNRQTRFLGKISYSLYLNHPTTIFLLSPCYVVIYSLPWPLTIKYAACALFTFSILVPLSYGTYRIIEEPGIRFGSRLIKRISARLSLRSELPGSSIALAGASEAYPVAPEKVP